MVLHSEQRQLPMPNSFDRSVIQVQVGYLERRSARDTTFVPNDSEAMVLRRDQHLVVAQVLDWMVATPVPVRQLRCSAAERQADQLMPKTDPEGGEPGP
jgi:hypothetical protein